MAGGEDSSRVGGRRSAFTQELRDRFLALLRETGNARASARALGHRHLFNNRIRRDPLFRRQCREAVEIADARLREVPGPFLPPLETKADADRGIAPVPPELAPGGREPVIRRTSNGRTQISYVRDGFWTSEIEERFLARLRATGNVDASARAVGFHPTTVYKRMEKWPAFKRACDEALDQASVTLDYRLVAHAHACLRRPGEPREEGEEDEEEIPFDPVMAMRILDFIDRRAGGRTTRGRRAGPPERPFEEAKANILRKIEAIERHREMRRAGPAEQPGPGRGDGGVEESRPDE